MLHLLNYQQFHKRGGAVLVNPCIQYTFQDVYEQRLVLLVLVWHHHYKLKLLVVSSNFRLHQTNVLIYINHTTSGKGCQINVYRSLLN